MHNLSLTVLTSLFDNHYDVNSVCNELLKNQLYEVVGGVIKREL